MTFRRRFTQLENKTGFLAILFLIVAIISGTTSAGAQEKNGLSDSSFEKQVVAQKSLVPSFLDRKPQSFGDRLVRTITLRDYNTRVVLLGTVLLGICAGVIGTFMVLRQRALVGDVIGHSALPGIACAFLIMEAISPGTGKSVPGLLAGAFVSGTLGVVGTLLFRRIPRIKEDAAQAIILSGLFGLGIVLFTAIQKIPQGNAAGLDQFIFGKAASMLASDVWLIGAVSLVLLVTATFLRKELTILCFDEEYTSARGWPVGLLDLALMGLVVSVCVIGMQSVGMLLVVALLIIPPAAARFWTNQINKMLIVAAVMGGLSSMLGILLSSMFPRLSAGAVIVLCGTLVFLFSLMFGKESGVLRRLLVERKVQTQIGLQDLIRAFYEIIEQRLQGEARLQRDTYLSELVSLEDLLAKRSWSQHRLHRLMKSARSEDLLEAHGTDQFRLTSSGVDFATRVVRNHRLWEIYLMKHADIATSRVDRSADRIEHALGPEMIEELEAIMKSQAEQFPPMPSPHQIPAGPEASAT
ncbi:Manganese transport system membrane protein MntB [Polystyrenella longa]|uniref:Manganese transport system membrane protein MntB n=1 Tax=Polystyrenella longa TaxID=2528007 RepID=A0A518CNR8_9PLAN|nr:iron chelate uptake ABC transporter family permease subunit [Polystyrenella longa]QDU80834.1 Manganese transport system membrane protein MntB [Polystyrenella longa]